MSDARLFLVWHGAPEADVALAEPTHGLAPGLFMVRSERALSPLYHAIKRALPADTPLIVSPVRSPNRRIWEGET